MFALFDGHGGNGMSTKLANELHLVIHQNLEDLLPSICEAWKEARQGRRKSKVSFVGIDDIEEQASCTWHPSLEELITGGLESAFWMMDKAALASKKEWKVIIVLEFLDICAKKNSKHKKGCLIFLNGGRWLKFFSRYLAAALPWWHFSSVIESLSPTLVTPEPWFTDTRISSR